MEGARFVAEYAKSAMSKCKEKKYCKTDKKIEKGVLRLGKIYASDRFTDGGEQTDWFHPRCLFSTFTRVRPTSRKIMTEADVEGFEGLKPEDQEMIRELIKEFVPAYKVAGATKKKTTAKKAKDVITFSTSPVSSMVITTKPSIIASSATAATPTKKIDEEGTYEYKVVMEGENGKEVMLGDGANSVGRGETFGVIEACCSRNQVEVTVNTKTGQVKAKLLGKNPSCLFKGVDPLAMNRGTEYAVSDGDQIQLIPNKHTFTFKITKQAKPPAVAATAAVMSNDKKRPSTGPSWRGAAASSSSQPAAKKQEIILDDEEEEEDEDFKPKDDEPDDDFDDDLDGADEGGDPRPMCQYGASCYRKNPEHFKEFRHPNK